MHENLRYGSINPLLFHSEEVTQRVQIAEISSGKCSAMASARFISYRGAHTFSAAIVIVSNKTNDRSGIVSSPAVCLIRKERIEFSDFAFRQNKFPRKIHLNASRICRNYSVPDTSSPRKKFPGTLFFRLIRLSLPIFFMIGTLFQTEKVVEDHNFQCYSQTCA